MGTIKINGRVFGGPPAPITKLTQAEYNALPEAIRNKGIYVITDAEELVENKDAKNINYDDSHSGLGSNVQDAIDNLNNSIQEILKRPAPVTLQTGTFKPGVTIITNNTSSHTITFSNAFDSIPTVYQTTTWSGKDPGGSADNRVKVNTTISNITRTGFSVTFQNASPTTLYAYNIAMEWRAEAEG